jgi:hypothetical protein
VKRHLIALAWIACVLSGAAVHGQDASSSFIVTQCRPTRADKAYPKFHIGPTGINATVEKGLQLTVFDTDAHTPAAGKFKQGDIITAVNGRSVTDPEIYICLGEAITEAEAGNGNLAFTVTRGGKTETVTITLPVLGSYSPTFPLNCKKSDAIIKACAERIARDLGERVVSTDFGFFGALGLLSTGDDAYLPVVKKHLMKHENKSQTWQNGYYGLAMSEYYLRTGDKEILPKLKIICDDSVERMKFGGWNQWGKGINPGYTQGGLMNPAGVPVLATLILAQECGIEVNKAAFETSLKYFYRFVGHGGVPYGNHRCEDWLGSNGKNGMLASAFSLLEGENYRQAKEWLALDTADAYFQLGAGHGSSFPNHIWTGIGASHVSPSKLAHYRRCMDKRKWYLDLCRRPDGSFGLLNLGAHVGDYPDWGEGLLLTFTAPRRTLRITGAPKTKYSRKVVVPERPWGRPADTAFFGTEHCKGFGTTEFEPHEIELKLKALPRKNDRGAPQELKGDVKTAKAFCVQMIRHQHPVFRQIAAKVLVTIGAHDEVLKALKHPDARVRRAALEGIDNHNSYFGSKAVLTREEVSKIYLPAINKILANPKLSFWELDAAIFALGRAMPADIYKHDKMLRKYLYDEEWWLRQSAAGAIIGMAADEEMMKPQLKDYLTALRNEPVIQVWRRMMGHLSAILNDPNAGKDFKDTVARGMLELYGSIPIAEGEMRAIGLASRGDILRYFFPRYQEMTPQVLSHFEAALKEHGVEGIGGPGGFGYFVKGGWGHPGILNSMKKLPEEERPAMRARLDRMYATIRKHQEQEGNLKAIPSWLRATFEEDQRPLDEQLNAMLTVARAQDFTSREIQNYWNMHGAIADMRIAFTGVRNGPPSLLDKIARLPAEERTPLLQTCESIFVHLEKQYADWDVEKENPETYDNTKGPGAKNAVVNKWRKFVEEMRERIAEQADL